MKKTVCLLLSLCLLSAFAACGGQTQATPSAAPRTAGAGTYRFLESALDGALQVPFTVELREDGGYAITEENHVMGACVYTGSSYAWRGDYFTTGPIEEGGTPQAGWFEEDGSCVWVVLDGGQVRPMRYVEPAEEQGGSLRGLAYAGDSAAQVLDVYLPEGEGPFPVIVLVHGGGFMFGDQRMAILEPIFAATEEGFAVVSVDYRKASEATFPAAVADVKAAVRWVRANAGTYGFDTARIAVWGESAGAYLAVMTALTPQVEALNGDVTANLEQSSAVAALVSFYAPVEFAAMDAEYAAMGRESSFGTDSSFESKFLGEVVGADPESTARSYWGTYADELPEGFALRAWIQAGDADGNVPYTQSVNLAERLRGLLGEDCVSFGMIEGATHQDAAFYTAENLAAVYAFLRGAMG